MDHNLTNRKRRDLILSTRWQTGHLIVRVGRWRSSSVGADRRKLCQQRLLEKEGVQFDERISRDQAWCPAMLGSPLDLRHSTVSEEFRARDEAGVV